MEEPMTENNILDILKRRFETHPERHVGLEWYPIAERLHQYPAKLRSLVLMEQTGGEPDVVDYDATKNIYTFIDCSPETPKGRRSLCYDNEALEARKEFKPMGNAIQMAQNMGADILNEEQYRMLQSLGEFDLKTSSWILTPSAIRKLGGAIFADRRYDTVFVYHNGAQSYYGSRAFRCILYV